jgi:hypothetical protein
VSGEYNISSFKLNWYTPRTFAISISNIDKKKNKHFKKCIIIIFLWVISWKRKYVERGLNDLVWAYILRILIELL